MLEELVGKILMAKELQGTAEGESFRKQFGDGGFHPGEVRDDKLPVQPGLINYQAVIDVVNLHRRHGGYRQQCCVGTNC